MRTTMKDLEHSIDRLNALKGYDNNKIIGSYRLSGAYGGYAVHDLTGGHIPCRECHNFIQGMIQATYY